MKYENEVEIDVGRCIRTLGRKWNFLIIMAVLFGIVGFILTLDKEEDRFTATSTVYAMSGDSYNDAKLGVSAMNEYSDIVTSMKVCERAALLMGNPNVNGETIMKATSVDTGEKEKTSSSIMAQTSTILKITCEYSDPVVAMEMAQAVSDAFTIEMENILGSDAVKPLDKPFNYKVSYDATQNQWKTRIMMFAFGAVVAAVIVVLGEIFNPNTCTIRECTLQDELPIIGVIPDYKD